MSDDKQRKVDIIKYSNGIQKIQFYWFFYLPRRLYNRDGLFNDIVKFVSDNTDTIKAITWVASSVAHTIKTVKPTTLNIVKKARELKNCPFAITEKATDKVLKAFSELYYV